MDPRTHGPKDQRTDKASYRDTWTHLKTLEKVQARAARLESNKHRATYEERLERRERGDAIEIYKTLNGVNRVRTARTI